MEIWRFFFLVDEAGYVPCKMHQGQNVSKNKSFLFFTSSDRVRRADSEYV